MTRTSWQVVALAAVILSAAVPLLQARDAAEPKAPKDPKVVLMAANRKADALEKEIG